MAASYIKPTITGVFQVPLLIGAFGVVPGNDIASVAERPVVNVQRFSTVIGNNAVIAKIAHNAGIYRSNIPLLVGGPVPGILTYVTAGTCRAVFHLHYLAAVSVYQYITSVDGLRHIFTPVYIDYSLGIGLSLLIACASRNFNCKGSLGALPVVKYLAILRNKTIRGGSGLAFGAAYKSLYFALGGTVNRCGCPVGPVFGIGQAAAKTGFNEFSPGQFGGTPPNARLHTIFHTDHSFHHIMQFVVGGVMSVGAYRFEKQGVIVETSGQLMSIAFVQTAFQGIIPTQGFVGVQGIASADANTIEARIVA